MASEFEDSYEDMERVKGAFLETPVSELMAEKPLVIDADATVVAAVNAMNERHTGCVLVQKAGRLVGILTERDLLRKVIFRDGNRRLEDRGRHDPQSRDAAPQRQRGLGPQQDGR